MAQNILRIYSRCTKTNTAIIIRICRWVAWPNRWLIETSMRTNGLATIKELGHGPNFS